MRGTAVAIIALFTIGAGQAAPGPLDLLRQIGLPGVAFDRGGIDGGAPGFDAAGVAYSRSGATLFIRDGKRRQRVDFAAAAATAINRDLFTDGQRWDGGWDQSFSVDTNIVFDDRDYAYAVVTPRLSNLRNAVLLWSDDHARSWHAIRLAGITATIETRDGFNDLSGPPSVLSHQNYSAQRGGRLWLETFRRYDDGNIRRARPAVLTASNSLLAQKHSGAGNSSYSRGSRIFVVYPTDGRSESGGTASYIREFDQRRNAFTGDALLLGSSRTRSVVPDDHDFPVITGDRAGALTVVIGGHHAPFLVTTSRAPQTIAAGWTDPRPIGDDGGSGYTYPSLNTTPDQTINIFARQEDRRYAFNLVQLRKPFRQDFQTWPGGTPYRVIAASPRRFYVVWRQRVTMDREGNLYLNFRYEPNQLDEAEARQMNVDRTGVSNCRGGRCFYKVTSNEGVTLVSRDAGRTFTRY